MDTFTWNLGPVSEVGFDKALKDHLTAVGGGTIPDGGDQVRDAIVRLLNTLNTPQTTQASTNGSASPSGVTLTVSVS